LDLKYALPTGEQDACDPIHILFLVEMPSNEYWHWKRHNISILEYQNGNILVSTRVLDDLIWDSYIIQKSQWMICSDLNNMYVNYTLFFMHDYF
jgi:hypothetical protein